MEGLAHRGRRRPGLLVLSPTPEEGGGMDHVVGAELAWAAAHAGFPTLRFNWRGVGASPGPRGDFTQLVEEARAAIVVARENADGAAPLVASIGSSARIATSVIGDAAGVCLVSPTDIEVRAPLGERSKGVPAERGKMQWGRDVWVVVAQSDLSDRLRVATSRLTVIAGADRTFQKNLPRVGKAVVECLNVLETLR